MRPPTGRGGVSLIELVMAVGLATLALAALSRLTCTAALYQVRALRSSDAQMNAALAMKTVEREMAEATYLLAPAPTGAPARTLAACANAQPAPGGGAPVPIDPARPMRFFAFCQADGTFYLHALTGCPAAYVCGSSPAVSVGEGLRPVSAVFLRPPEGGVIQVALTASSGGITSSRDGSYAVAASAGMNP